MRQCGLLVALLSGCSGDGDSGAAVDATPMSSTKFTPLLCTSGSPGEPTCPVTHVSLAFARPLTLTMVASPSGQGLLLSSMQVSSSTAVHVDNMRLEVWCPDCFQPLYTALLGSSLDVGPSGVALENVTLASFQQTQQLAISVDAIR